MILSDARRPMPQPVAVVTPGLGPAHVNQTEQQARDITAAIIKTRMELRVNAAQFTLMFQCFFVVTILAPHLKQQIASPRAVLIPGYRGPHLVVAAAFYLPVVLLLPLLISIAFHFPFWSMLAVIIPFLTLVLWAWYLQSRVLMAAGMLLWFSAYWPPGRRAFVAALTQTPLLPALGLIAVASAALFLLTRRFLTLREEMPAYGLGVPTNTWGHLRSGSAPVPVGAGVNYNSALQRFFTGPSDRYFDRLDAAPASLWARLRRWSVIWNNKPFLGMFVVVVAGQVVFFKYSGREYAWGMLVGQLAFFSMIPLLSRAQRLLPTLGYESLRPLRRSAYLRERALAVAAQTAQFWLALAGAVIALTAVLSPPTLHLPDFWLAIAASVFLQIPALALTFWVLRFRSPLLLYAMMIVPFGFIYPVTLGLGSVHPSVHPMAPRLFLIAAAVGLLSVLILFDAYRRWLRTDLA